MRASFIINASLINASKEKVVLEQFLLSYRTHNIFRSYRQRLVRIAFPVRPRKRLGNGIKYIGVWFTEFGEDDYKLEAAHGNLDAKEMCAGYLLFASFTWGGWNPRVAGNTVSVRLRAKLTSGECIKFCTRLGVLSDASLVQNHILFHGRKNMIRKFAVLAVVGTLCSSVLAKENAPPLKEVEALRQQGYSVRTIAPIFSQLVTFSFPKGFVPAFEDAKGGQYIQESVLEGESLKKWSQMVTITGAKGLASNPNLTPAQFADRMAGGFKRTCPDSYTATGLGKIKFGSHDGFAAVVSCGVANPVGESYSESMLLIVIKGKSDYYTIQWAERGKASKTPIKFDDAKWVDRFKRLTPIKLCPIVPGEQAPYPSCVNHT